MIEIVEFVLYREEEQDYFESDFFLSFHDGNNLEGRRIKHARNLLKGMMEHKMIRVVEKEKKPLFTYHFSPFTIVVHTSLT